MRRTLAVFLAAALFWLSPGLGAHEAAAAVTGSFKAPGNIVTLGLPVVGLASILGAREGPGETSLGLVSVPAPAPSLLPLVPSGELMAPTAFEGLVKTVNVLAQPQSDAGSLLDSVFDASLGASPASPIVLGFGGQGPTGLGAPTYKSFSRDSNPGPGAPRERKPTLKERINQTYGRFLTLLKRTSAEIFIVGAIDLVIGAGYGANHETVRAKYIPLGFSEIHQIERDAHYQNAAIEPMTRYLTGANDLTMKVFESWNESHERTYAGSNVKYFASELDRRMDPALKFHLYEIYDYLRDLPSQADSALLELNPFLTVNNGLQSVNSDFSRSWSESHIDSYRTEYYTVTVDDGGGKSHTETRSRRVYDHTTHSYRYDKPAGERASSGLDALIDKIGTLTFRETLRTASQTNAEGEYGAEKSRRNFSRHRPTQKELFEFANMWATGSTLNANLPAIMAGWAALRNDADIWRSAKTQAQDAWYITHSHSDAGPREYQAAQTALSNGLATATAVSEIVEGITFTRAQLPVLEAMIRQIIDIEMNYKKGDSKKLMRQIVALSQDIYGKNFKNGFDVDPYRVWFVLLLALSGLVAGGLAGWGLDYAGDKKGWYNKLLLRGNRSY